MQFVFHQFFAPYLTNSLHYLLPMIYTHTQIIFSGVLIGWSMNHSDQLFHDTCRDIQPLAQIPFCWVRPAPPHPPNVHYYICCFLSTAACSGHCCLDQISWTLLGATAVQRSLQVPDSMQYSVQIWNCLSLFFCSLLERSQSTPILQPQYLI